jgi:hypothetical protein
MGIGSFSTFVSFQPFEVGLMGSPLFFTLSLAGCPLRRSRLSTV